MNKIAKFGALLLLLLSSSMLVAGCSGGDAGMGKKGISSMSEFAG